MNGVSPSIISAQALLADQARQRSLVLFVGAGASADAKLPSWKGLLAPLAAQLGVEADTDVLDLAQWYADAQGRPVLLEPVRGMLEHVTWPGRFIVRSRR